VVLLHLLVAIDSDDVQSKHNEVVFEIVQIRKYKYKMESTIQKKQIIVLLFWGEESIFTA
jgi:hypothetical protein